MMPGVYGYAYTNFILTAAAILLSLVVAGVAWNQRRIPGAMQLIWLTLIGVVWGIIYMTELLVKSTPIIVLLDDLQFIPASFCAPLFLQLTMNLTGKLHSLRKWTWVLYIFPIVSVAMIATNNWHFLFRTHVPEINTTGGPLFQIHVIQGPFFWAIIGYSGLLLLASLLLLVLSYLRAPKWTRSRIGGLIITTITILLAAVFSVPAWINNIQLNLTLVALLMAVMFMAYSLLSNRMFDVIPLAGSTLLSQINDAVITLNAHGEIIDFNSSAARLPVLNIPDHVGESFQGLLKEKLDFELSPGWAIDHSEEVIIRAADHPYTYDMRVSPLNGEDHKTVGMLVVMRDITHRRVEELERVRIQERYHTILENASYGILLLDHEGRIQECNDQFAQLSGFAADSLPGRLAPELVPELSPCTPAEGDSPQPTQEMTLRHASGELIPVDTNIIPLSSGEEISYFVTLQDIRERKKSENITQEALANVQLRVNDLAVMRNVTESLNQATSLRGAVLPVLETIKTITESNSVWIFLLGKTRDSYQRIEYHPLSENNLLVIDNQTGKIPHCLMELSDGSLEDGELVRDCPCSTLTGERKHRAFPLYIGKQPLGVVNFIEEEAAPLNENKVRLLQTICGSLAVAIERVRLFKGEYDQRKLAETFRDISTALTTSLDLNEVLDLLLDQLSRIVPYDGASVLLVEDNVARIARMRGFELSNKKSVTQMQNKVFSLESTANIRTMLTSRTPVIIEDTHQDKQFIQTSVSKDYHSYLGVPVINEGRVEAIFSLDKVEPGFYTEEHARLISSFALQASLAIRNARLFQAEQIRIRQLDGLRETLTAISSQLEVKVLLREILRRAVNLINAEIGEIALYHAGNEELEIVASENLDPETVGEKIKRGEGLFGKVVETLQAQSVTNYSEWGNKIPGYENYGIETMLGVPMLGANEELLGVIGVGYIHKKVQNTQEDIRLLNLFAQQATVALRNARLYEDARRAAEEAETIRKAGAVVVSTLNQEKATSLILEQLAQVVPYDSASVLLYTKNTLKIVGGHGFNDISPILGLEITLDRSNPGARVFLDNAPLKISNISESAPEFNRISKNNHPIHSWLGVPLRIQNQPIGILSLDGHHENQFTEEHERLVSAFADQVAIALENARLYESALQSASRFETLYKLSQVISSNIRSEEIYPAIHEATSELMETEFFSISIVNDKAGLIEDVYMMDKGEPVPLSSRPLGQGLFGRVLESGKSILFNTFSDDMIAETGAVVIGDSPDEQVSQSVLVVPLKIGVRLVGVLSAQSYQPYAYTDTDVELLELLGANVAIAIENARLFSEVQELAVTDPLTGLYNRRKLIDLGESEFHRSTRYERQLSAIMLDCDHFKHINDTYGHTVGDQVLRKLSEIALNTIRKADILGRYGGDEFMILLPETGPEAALKAAERLRFDVNSTPFATNAGNLHFSISVGVASLDLDVHNLGELLDRADYASYVSKDSGGNRVTIWSPYLARRGWRPNQDPR